MNIIRIVYHVYLLFIYLTKQKDQYKIYIKKKEKQKKQQEE
jgi:hypothetical protein